MISSFTDVSVPHQSQGTDDQETLITAARRGRRDLQGGHPPICVLRQCDLLFNAQDKLQKHLTRKGIWLQHPAVRQHSLCPPLKWEKVGIWLPTTLRASTLFMDSYCNHRELFCTFQHLKIVTCSSIRQWTARFSSLSADKWQICIFSKAINCGTDPREEQQGLKPEGSLRRWETTASGRSIPVWLCLSQIGRQVAFVGDSSTLISIPCKWWIDEQNKKKAQTQIQIHNAGPWGAGRKISISRW